VHVELHTKSPTFLSLNASPLITNSLNVYRTAGGGKAADGKQSTTISWRSDVQDNSRLDSAMKGGNSTGRRKWSIRSGRSGSGRGGSSLLGHLEDDDLDCDLFDDDLDFRHQHDDTTSVHLHINVY